MDEKLVVKEGVGALRLDRYLSQVLPRFSRTRLQNLIRQGFVRRNGQPVRARDSVRPGDIIEVSEPAPQKTGYEPEAIPLAILFEDSDLVVINKAAGMVVHPGAGHREHTLVNALLHHCSNLSGIGGEERPGIVHRLDKETSGCLVVAKNDEAHRGLAAQFAGRTVEKIYLALVAGKLKKPVGTIDQEIARHPVHRKRMTARSSGGRAAKTEYRVVAGGHNATLVECRLHSGRTHQIRVHFHHLGHPLLGDKVYAPKLARDFPRQMLHAWKLGFAHPRTNEQKQFEAPLPADFSEAMRMLGIEAKL